MDNGLFQNGLIPTNQINSGLAATPLLAIENDGTTKISHDRYDVYVNKDYVGRKVLLTQGEDVTDVADFLKSHGLNKFASHIDGDHLHIDSNDTAEQTAIKDALSIYLQMR